MTREQIVQETKCIVEKVLKHSDFTLAEDVSAGEIKGWDSLSHMVIISEIEKHFNINFSFAEIISFHDMRDLFDCLVKKTGL